MVGVLNCEYMIDFEVFNYIKVGKLFWNVLFILLIYDDYGDFLVFVGFQKDVIDRKIVMVENFYVEKMKVLGWFVGGVVYEVNSLLQLVVFLLGFIKDGMFVLMEDEWEWLDFIEDSGKFVWGFLKSVLSYVCKDQDDLGGFFDFVEVVGWVVFSLWFQFLGIVCVDVIFLLEGQCGQVQGCGESLISGVVEFGCNVVYVMSNFGIFVIEIMVLQDWISIMIVDIGFGIFDVVCFKIFELFYIIKFIGQGIGLGLVLVYSYIF